MPALHARFAPLTRRITAVAFVFAVAGLLGGCYEKVTTDAHSPGVYKGKADSAQVMHPSEDARQALRARFHAGQTDR